MAATLEEALLKSETISAGDVQTGVVITVEGGGVVGGGGIGQPMNI